LDAALREEMRGEIRRLVKDLGLTAVYVTHDQTEALTMSDWVAVMAGGQLLQEGTPEQIYFDPQNPVIAGFVGKINLLEGKVLEEGGEKLFAAVRTGIGVLRCRGTSGEVKGGAVLVAWRPETIECHRERENRTNVVEGAVTSMSFLGDSVIYVVKTGSAQVVCKSGPLNRFRLGEKIFVRFPPECGNIIPKSEGGHERNDETSSPVSLSGMRLRQ
jgi:iron(III) transport system ATP-binding protein